MPCHPGQFFLQLYPGLGADYAWITQDICMAEIAWQLQIVLLASLCTLTMLTIQILDVRFPASWSVSANIMFLSHQNSIVHLKRLQCILAAAAHEDHVYQLSIAVLNRADGVRQMPGWF